MPALFSLWNSIQQYLLPHIEENIGALTEKEAMFVRVAELACVDRHIGPYRWSGFGRKPKDRKAMALAFIAKAVWNFPTTAALVEYLKAGPAIRRLGASHGRPVGVDVLQGLRPVQRRGPGMPSA